MKKSAEVITEVIDALIEAVERYQLADASEAMGAPIAARTRRAEASALADAAIALARPKPAAVRVRECPECDGTRFAEDGGRCFCCGGKGRLATAGGEA